jgi:hypothetical protein
MSAMKDPVMRKWFVYGQYLEALSSKALIATYRPSLIAEAMICSVLTNEFTYCCYRL